MGPFYSFKTLFESRTYYILSTRNVACSMSHAENSTGENVVESRGRCCGGSAVRPHTYGRVLPHAAYDIPNYTRFHAYPKRSRCRLPGQCRIVVLILYCMRGIIGAACGQPADLIRGWHRNQDRNRDWYGSRRLLEIDCEPHPDTDPDPEGSQGTPGTAFRPALRHS